MPIVEEDRGTYIFNSKDLCMIDHIPELVEAGIYSLKIEGRIKTAFYVGTVVRVYREAIDDYLTDPALYDKKRSEGYYITEVAKASYRGFTTGFYYGKPNHEEQIYTTSSYIRTYDFIGMVKEYDSETGFALIEQRNKFVKGDEVEFISPNGVVKQTIGEIYTLDGQLVESAPHPQQLLRVKVDTPLKPFDMMRKEVVDEIAE
jgi:putative protease